MVYVKYRARLFVCPADEQYYRLDIRLGITVNFGQPVSCTIRLDKVDFEIMPPQSASRATAEQALSAYHRLSGSMMKINNVSNNAAPTTRRRGLFENKDGAGLINLKDSIMGMDPSSAHGSCSSVLSRATLQFHNEHLSLDSSQQESSTEPFSESCRSLTTSNSGGNNNSPHAPRRVLKRQHSSSSMERVVKQYARALSDPQVSEKHAQLILQTLLNVFSSRPITGNSINDCAAASGMMPSQESHSFEIAHSYGDSSLRLKAIAIEHGLLPSILAAMKAHKDSCRIQSRAVRLLGSLAEDPLDTCLLYTNHNAVNDDDVHDDNSAAHRQAQWIQDELADCHSVTYILAALVAHTKYESLCLEACASLYIMTLRSTRSTAQLAHSGGVQTLLSVMKRYLKNQGLQQYALSVIYQLVTNDKLIDSVQDPELFEVVLSVLSKHKKNLPILRVGIYFLHSLALKGSKRTKSSLVHCLAPKVLLKAMTVLTHDTQHTSALQLLICQALLSLARERPEARDLLKDGIPTIVEAMQQCSAIQPTACQILALL